MRSIVYRDYPSASAILKIVYSPLLAFFRYPPGRTATTVPIHGIQCYWPLSSLLAGRGIDEIFNLIWFCIKANVCISRVFTFLYDDQIRR